ncbi:MAG: hypothetical protein COA78_37885, partial [Blastopirellula sp.]
RPESSATSSYPNTASPGAVRYPNTNPNYAPLTQPATANNYPPRNYNNTAGRQAPGPAPVVKLNSYPAGSASGTRFPTDRRGAATGVISDSTQQQPLVNPATSTPAPAPQRQPSGVGQPWRGPTASTTAPPVIETRPTNAPGTSRFSSPNPSSNTVAAPVSRFAERTPQPQLQYQAQVPVTRQEPQINRTPERSGYQPQYQAKVPATPLPAISRNSSGNAVVNDQIFAPAKIIALVGGDPILAGDILGPVNQMINQNLAKLTKEERGRVSESEIAEQRMKALKMILPGAIETRMVSLDFMRKIPRDKLEEFQAGLDAQYDDLQLETDLKNANVNSPAELDLKLRSLGSSLAKKRRAFTEQMIAHQQMRSHIDRGAEVTHQELLDYYHEQAATYRSPTKVKWEQLMVKFSNFPDKGAAEHAIVDMGNQVLRGAPLDAVAKRHSQGIRAARGGQYDWTTQGGLKNEAVDQAIFSLPVRKMSQIISSSEGFHIVRVTEREEESMEPFTEAQVAIKKNIQDNRVKQQMRDYLDKVRLNTEVWTIFDEPEISTARVPTSNSQNQPNPTSSPVPSRFQ